jgi:hypothetical protein
MNPLLDYAGVELKQGGVLLDADANELVAILDRRLRALASDTLGRATVSSTTPEAFKIKASGGTLQIGRGRLYVDGLLAECHGAPSDDPAQETFDDLLGEPGFAGDLDYLHQPYLKVAPDLPKSGRHLVYLDVWDREVTNFEQPDLVEIAVGVETSSRIQTVWQVRVLADDAGGGTTCETDDGSVPGWSAIIAPSAGRLTIGTYEVAQVDDPCELPPTGGFRGLENQLYRVEIHDPGQAGAGATFKWSRENNSVASAVEALVSASVLQLDTLGRDDVLRFNSGDWVEITDDFRELSQLPGEIRKITVEESTRRLSFTKPLPADMLPSPASFPDQLFPRERHLRVRRWDQARKVFKVGSGGNPVEVQDLDVTGSTGVIDVPGDPATKLMLENGITVSFDVALGSSGGFRTGDYWVFAARTADASVEILKEAPPRGIHHHFARLGIWDLASGEVSDCRHHWPPESAGGSCGCTCCVTPESHATGKLTIQNALDTLRDTGGTVCLVAGDYVLREPVRLSGMRCVRVTGQGAATRIVTPGSAFIVERCAGITIDELAIFSLGQQSAIGITTAFGLTLRQLLIATFRNPDAQSAAIALGGIVAGANIHDNLLIAPNGVHALEPGNQKAVGWLITAAMAIDSNIFACRDSAITMDGLVGHALQSRVTGNQVIGTHQIGFSFTGMALPGASLDVRGNNLATHGPGMRCATDGLWVSENKLHATSDGNFLKPGAGIQLVTGLDRNGSDEAQLIANQLDGFAGAGIEIDAPVLDLIVKQNIIERCANGILMTGSAGAASASIENNHVHDIGLAATGGSMTVGIGVIRADVATIAGNIVRRIGLDVQGDKTLLAGILALSVRRSRIGNNEITQVGPEQFGNLVAGISVRAPYERAEVSYNHVERDADFNVAYSDTQWHALSIEEPIAATNEFASRLGNFMLLKVDATRTLVAAGNRAWLQIAPPAIEPVTGEQVKPPGASASLLGNVFVARGRGPAVDVAAAGDAIFGDNVVELRGARGSAAVQIRSPVAIVNANRVRGGEVSISIPMPKSLITAIGNITERPFSPPIAAPMDKLNLIG